MKLFHGARRAIPRYLVLGSALVAFLSTFVLLAKEPDAPVPVATAHQPTLYLVGYAHLDTQWRWSYPQVIAEFLHHTMEDNYKLFEKYPHYVFNFTGANRYAMMKEYFPEDYAKLKEYVKAGRWYPAGSSMEEGDVNMPNGESIIRQVLYGNQYFRREFGVASDEFMLPDCFGFQASLPSVLAHCGLKGFSTQKLTWGSAVGVPFNVGVWEGPDGKSIVSALNCGAYDAGINNDQSKDKTWIKRIESDGQKSGVYIDYRYYGTGDRGGAPSEKSVANVEKSVTSDGPIKVISSKADAMFKALTPAQIAALPKYKGDLLLTNHSCGSLSSQAFVKRSNRKLEELGDAAERAAVFADWIGTSPYPREKLLSAWTLQLGAHFHDTMAGTALPKSYEYTWNNMLLALNQFAAIAQDSVGGVVQGMDTSGNGMPLVIYNPLSVERDDVVEATIPNAPEAFGLFDPAGKEVAYQIDVKSAQGTQIRFLAHVPSISFSVYSIRSGAAPAAAASSLSVTDRTVENANFKVILNDAGDIASILDKRNNKQVLSAPARLEFLHENPKQFPAWNMDYADRIKPPVDYVSGPCTFRISENGPVSVALETTRQTRGSTITQEIRLSAGEAGDKIEVVNHIDWQSREVSLKASFPMTVSNPDATYESQSAAVLRGNNTKVKFEVPQQQWFDLTAGDGSYGAAILNDCKYGSDKPDDNTVRLTLLYTPGTQGGYQDQGTQDIGRHDFVYAIAPHAGTWQHAKIPWSAQRLNQPLMAFSSAPHTGSLGKTASVASVNKPNVMISAMKKAEESDEVIIRLHETDGTQTEGTAVSFAYPVESAREVDGQEREIAPAKVVGGKLVTEMGPFRLRAFAVKLGAAATHMSAPVSQAVDLAYDTDAVSTHDNLGDGSFDADGHTYSAEALPEKINSEGIEFKVGPTKDGMKNALACKGQTIQLPGGAEKVYILAASAGGDLPVSFKINGTEVKQVVQDWSGYVGQWDNRIWQGVVPELTYNWSNKFAGLKPGFVKQDTVAWFCSHRHDPTKGNEYYKFTYLFKYGFDLPAGATSITLPDNDKVRLFAMTTVKSTHDGVTALQPLYDTLADHQYLSPTITPGSGAFNNAVPCTIEHSLYGRSGAVHYTLDGSEPTEASPVFEHPLFLSNSVTVRARQYQGSNPVGPETTAKYEINDTTPPAVVSASAVSIVPTATIVFSKPLKKESAEVSSNYTFSPAVGVTAASLSDDGMLVTLTLDKPVSSGTSSITVNGVVDQAATANHIAPKSTPVSVVEPIVNVDKFVADGKTGREFKAQGLSGNATSPWTINFYMHADEQPDDRTMIAGFGTNEDKTNGAGRFVCKFEEGFHFWARNQDVTGTPVDTGKWQMVTAAYDGTTVRLYKNGKQIGESPIELSNDDTTVRIAPIDAWEHTRRFKGEIRDFTIWSMALQPAQISAMMPAMPR